MRADESLCRLCREWQWRCSYSLRKFITWFQNSKTRLSSRVTQQSLDDYMVTRHTHSTQHSVEPSRLNNVGSSLSEFENYGSLWAGYQFSLVSVEIFYTVGYWSVLLVFRPFESNPVGLHVSCQMPILLFLFSLFWRYWAILVQKWLPIEWLSLYCWKPFSWSLLS